MNPEIILRLVWAGIVVVAAGIGYMLVDGALFLASGTGPAPVAVNAAPDPAAAPGTGPKRQVNLAGLNLFGNPQAAQTVAPETAESAPETRLKITLIGVFVADRNPDSAAIIASNRREQIYQVGDSLPGNATLAEVHPTYVLLKRAGGHERLSFEEPKNQLTQASGSAGPGSADAGRPGATRSARREVEQPGAFPDASGRAGAPSPAERARAAAAARRAANTSGVQNAREFIDTYGEKLASEPTATLAELGIEPVADGASSGYRLADVASPAALSRVGLRRGDVVLSVNGQELGNTQVDSALIDQVSAAGAARLEIQRGPRRFFVTLSIPK